MADQTQTPAPIIINVPPTQPSAVVAPIEPAQLKAGKEAKQAKIDEAKAEGANEILKSLGVKKSERARMIEDIRAGRMQLSEAKAEAKAAREEANKANERAAAAEDIFKPYKEQVEQITTTLKKYADAEFASLPESFQKAIVEMKLDDPARRLEMIDVFKRTGVLAAQAAPTTGTAPAADSTKTAAAAATEKKPATTMASPPATTSTPGAALNHYEHWKQLSNSGQHYLAAQYFNAHSTKILEQRPKNQ